MIYATRRFPSAFVVGLVLLLFQVFPPPAKASTALVYKPLFDQWGRPFSVTTETRLLLVSVNRSTGSWVHSCLSSLDSSFMEVQGWAYIADVSQMPAWSLTSYALPEMKKYPWPVAIVRDSADLKGWPIEPGQVTALELADQQVVLKQSFDNEKSLHAYLCSRPERSDDRMQAHCSD